nr:MAG TPA: hypothetical protein [Caudoviricetes sp.]
MPANLTLCGIYSWDNTIFEGLTVPATVERDALVNNILLECSELEVLYPDPDFLKIAIGSWASARQAAWKHYAKLEEVEYSPIENTDKYEDHTVTDSETESGTIDESGQQTTGVNQQDSTSGHSLTGVTRTQQGNNTDSVSAFDTESFSNKNKQTSDVDENSDTNYSASSDSKIARTDTTAHNTDTSTNKHRNFTHRETVHAHGNIGVTTNQQMMTQEVEFWKWDFIKQISNEFRQRFCVSVY